MMFSHFTCPNRAVFVPNLEKICGKVLNHNVDVVDVVYRKVDRTMVDGSSQRVEWFKFFLTILKT